MLTDTSTRAQPASGRNGTGSAQIATFRAPRGSDPWWRMPRVPLSKIAWLSVVIACLIAVVLLLASGYQGYAGVVGAVALSAAINLR